MNADETNMNEFSNSNCRDVYSRLNIEDDMRLYQVKLTRVESFPLEFIEMIMSHCRSFCFYT